jgi:hypothetical protein
MTRTTSAFFVFKLQSRKQLAWWTGNGEGNSEFLRQLAAIPGVEARGGGYYSVILIEK